MAGSYCLDFNQCYGCAGFAPTSSSKTARILGSGCPALWRCVRIFRQDAELTGISAGRRVLEDGGPALMRVPVNTDLLPGDTAATNRVILQSTQRIPVDLKP
jgi:hypothetical protein